MTPAPNQPDAGPALDAAIEAAVQAENAKHQLENFHVVLDGIADTNEDIPASLIDETRSIQRRVGGLAGEFEELATEKREEANHIRDNMGE